MRAIPTLAVALLAAGGIAACGSSHGSTTGTTAAPDRSQAVVDVYSSLPLSGSQAAEGTAIERGFEVGLDAYEQPAGYIDGYHVVVKPLDDATAKGWNPTKVVHNALAASADPRAAVYVGDLNSGATELSLPILNQAGIVQITPGSGYPGLTDHVADVTSQTEPEKFYPTGKMTLLRLIPDDMVQASAALESLQQTVKCRRVTAISFGSKLDGPALVDAVSLTAKQVQSYAMTYVPVSPNPSDSPSSELTYVETLRSDGVQCVVFTGRVTATAISLAKEIHAELPGDAILATSGLCNQGFTNERDGGIPAPLYQSVYCTSPVLPISTYKLGAATFVTAYRQKFRRHPNPSPYAAYGYLAGELTAIGLEGLEPGTDNRAAVRRTLLSGSMQYSTLFGKVYFDNHGNILSRRFGLWRVDSDGVPKLASTVTPTSVVAQLNG